MDNNATKEKKEDEEKKEKVETMVVEDANQPREIAKTTRAGSFAVERSFSKVVIVIYKKVLGMIRQIFGLVKKLRKFGNPNDLPSDDILQDMFGTTKVWLVDQIAKHFPPQKQVYLFRRWKKLVKKSRKLFGLGQGRARSLAALSGPASSEASLHSLPLDSDDL
jgi:hypothetical protein